LEEDVSQPLLEKKCMMAKVSGTNVQMEVFSWTHLVEKLLDRTIPLAFIMEKMQMAIYSLTDLSYTANFYLSYLMIV
jgi:hypothetical protein